LQLAQGRQANACGVEAAVHGQHAPGISQSTRSAPEGLAVDVGQRDAVAALEEPVRDRQADAARAAGDDGHWCCARSRGHARSQAQPAGAPHAHGSSCALRDARSAQVCDNRAFGAPAPAPPPRLALR